MTDAEMVPRAMAGDPSAIASLYERYFDFAVTVARRAGSRDPEDGAQTVFAWLLEGRWRLDPVRVRADGSIHAFVKTLTIYATLHSRRPGPAADDSARPLTARAPSPEALVLRQERICRLSRAILRLPLYLQRVARLRYLEELTGPDIAAAIGVQPHTVPGYFALIRQHLRHELADVYDLPMPDAATRYQRIDPRYQHEAR